ncbi:hypothetical protein EVAR_37498_1 [Eumeta japonica]|uniref:Uncharacterized protein n=1 Tax=Eumeta variegata TaxID=151549 RepID=A0A4C1XBY8_EUMVA|nr:hypothetical protein EVAR_37498_1 [Eumeta japonica]
MYLILAKTADRAGARPAAARGGESRAARRPPPAAMTVRREVDQETKHFSITNAQADSIVDMTQSPDMSYPIIAGELAGLRLHIRNHTSAGSYFYCVTIARYEKVNSLCNVTVFTDAYASAASWRALPVAALLDQTLAESACPACSSISSFEGSGLGK